MDDPAPEGGIGLCMKSPTGRLASSASRAYRAQALFGERPNPRDQRVTNAIRPHARPASPVLGLVADLFRPRRLLLAENVLLRQRSLELASTAQRAHFTTAGSKHRMFVSMRKLDSVVWRSAWKISIA